MEHQKSEVDVLNSNLSAEDNVATETNIVGTDLSNLVRTDVVQIEIVSQDEHDVATTVNEVKSEEIVVANDEVHENEENVAEEEGNEDDDGDDDGDEDGDGEYDDLDGRDEDEEYDDIDDVSFGDDDDDDDLNDVDFDDDNDVMEEEGDTENKEDGVFEDEDNQGSAMEGENEKEENEEKGGGSLEPKVKKLGKKNRRQEVIKSDLGKVNFKGEDKSKGDKKVNRMVQEDEENVKKAIEEENVKKAIEEKGEGSSKKNVKKLRKRNTRKVTKGNSEKVASKPEDKLGSSGRKKASKKVESMGMIFMCSSKTKKDCYRYNVLGLPANKRDLVGKIYKGMRLFLYDVDLKLLYGIYKAAGPGGYNLEPKAFKSQFPSQVHFNILEDCIPLAEEKFRKVIKENYFTRTKFDCHLKYDQVKKLCKLFVAATKGPRSERLDRNLKAKTHGSIDQDRSRARVVDKKRRRSALDEKLQYHDYPRIRQREVVASPLVPVTRVAPLPSPIAGPSYAYERTLGVDAYRHNVLVEHPDSYRRGPLLEHRDVYRREPPLDHRDVYREDPLLDRRGTCRRGPLVDQRDVYWQGRPLDYRDSYRRDVLVDRRDLRPIKLDVRQSDEIAGHDPYILYRERQSYRDPVYVEHLSPQRDRYHHHVGYRSRESPLPEYRSTRAQYRY
ncbi:hypothetical protein ACH5RR_010079 [Cinchona calisaya]|uniref:DCD domain-containing protein n=1 Tax=Cinchona calisaya TaxID=153742 RepID=A0ABD3AG83_9GENT